MGQERPSPLPSPLRGSEDVLGYLPGVAAPAAL
jgi:hypothetical protein